MFGTLGPFLSVLLTIVFIAVYLLLSLIAFNRGVPRRWLILLVNLVLGGTLIGWLVALYLATRRTTGDRSPRLSA
ncbi:superinfection immunity protein [Streptomyces sp. NBC_01497]|uniref:superinfection immunity protein n=1 Tax=Streptomyces sp. NBC_01497 TaxID=2903885 RepID=UPI002E2FA260|nr:superinfection immunity protein [Streptomyces sp. NBC_01497]